MSARPSISSSATPRLARGLLLTAASLALAACAHDASTPATDSSLARDLALAQSQRAPDPTFQDTVIAPAAAPRTERTSTPARRQSSDRQAPAPVAHAPVQTPAAAAPTVTQQATAPAAASNRVASGTSLQMTSGTRICTVSSPIGQTLMASVTSPIMGGNGLLIPAGAQVGLEVASLVPAQSSSVGGQIKFRVTSLLINGKDYPVQGDVYTLGSLERSPIPNTDPNAGKKKVIAGAVVGGILGQIMGHNTKGTIIGAAAGAAAGGVAAEASKNYEDCLPTNSPLELTLTSPIVIV